MLYFKHSQKLVSTQHAPVFLVYKYIYIYIYIYVLYLTATDTPFSMKSLFPIAKDIFQSLSISCGVIKSVRFRSILRN